MSLVWSYTLGLGPLGLGVAALVLVAVLTFCLVSTAGRWLRAEFGAKDYLESAVLLKAFLYCCSSTRNVASSSSGVCVNSLFVQMVAWTDLLS